MGQHSLLLICTLLCSIGFLARLTVARTTGSHAWDARTEVDLTPAQFFAWEEKLLTNGTLNNFTQYSTLFGFSTKPPGNSSAGACKVFPGDADWPAAEVWQAFNEVVDHALIKPIPSAHDCHDKYYGPYDASKCAYVVNNWNNSYFHADDPTSIDWPLWQGRTCLPTGSNGTDTCTLGGYPSYVVNVSTVAQVQLAVNFARNANLRLVVKNTGHDFFGKSTGAGALSIWTHHLKDYKLYDNYKTPSYSGKAIHVGSGVQAAEFYQYAEDNDVTVVGGECESVGVTGGYILGGGHSPLSSIYGMGADHVLALNVVTPDGAFRTASETTNADLFWALRGGGGSTYGVVTSVVVKAYPKLPVAISQFAFSTSATVSADAFWAGVRAYMAHFIAFADAGTYAYFYIVPLGDNQYTFTMRPFFAPNKTAPQLDALLAPWFAQLAALSIPVAANTTAHASFHAAWRAGFAQEVVGMSNSRSGSRLFPRANFADQASIDATWRALRSTTEQGNVLLAYNMKNAAPPGTLPSATNPHWHASYLHACMGGGVFAADATPAEVQATFDYLTDVAFGEWRRVAPTGGAYMSEADIFEPAWQEAFFGENYARLAHLKRVVDPWDVFYAPRAVGSEAWEVRTEDGLAHQNGRLCRKA